MFPCCIEYRQFNSNNRLAMAAYTWKIIVARKISLVGFAKHVRADPSISLEMKKQCYSIFFHPRPLLLFVRTIHLVYMMESPSNKMPSMKPSSGENASSQHLSALALFAFPKVWPENALRGNVGARTTRNKYADVPFDPLPSSAISQSVIIDNNITRRRSIITCKRFADDRAARRGITPSVRPRSQSW